MKIELSERMQAVASLVSKTGIAADVGCDHGYVAIWLVQNHICDRVIAMDVNKGPLERATENIHACGLEEYIETRLSNGAAALKPDEVDTLVCAGMGGRLMIQILREGADKVSTMKELVLQPQSDIQEMRRYLREHGMCIVAEDMVRDEDKFYPMMKVSVSDTPVLQETSEWQQKMEDTYGPCLLKQAHPVLQQYLLKRKEICRSIQEQLLKDTQPNDRQVTRAEEIAQEIRDIQAVLEEFFG